LPYVTIVFASGPDDNRNPSTASVELHRGIRLFKKSQIDTVFIAGLCL
jgi:hypothetical protein